MAAGASHGEEPQMPLSPDTPFQPSGATPGPSHGVSPAPSSPRPEIRPLSSGGPGSHAPGHIEKPPPQPVNKITQFEQRFSAKRHEDNWKRSPNINGTGAIHVKSFHCKLVGESLEFLDQQINEWLDAHPQYEVKFVNASIGEWTGKLKEPNLIVQVWV